MKDEKKIIENELIKEISLKRSLTSNYNYKILKRNTSIKSLEKFHYELELLPREEENSKIEQDQILFEKKNISLFKFFHHLFEPKDLLYFIIGIVGSIASGIINPIICYLDATVYSEIENTSEDRDSIIELEEMLLMVEKTMNDSIKKELIYGAVSLVSHTIGYFFLGLVSTRCLFNFKKKYFSTILSQEQGWFDSVNIFEFSTTIQTQIEYIELGLGENLITIIISFFVGILSLIFSFFGSWKLTLISLCISPFSFLVVFYMNKISFKGNILVRKAWQSAGGIAEEILYNIKTIASFVNFDYELKRFYEKVEISNRIELRSNLKIRIGVASLYFFLNLIIFVCFIYGRTLVYHDYNFFRGRDLTGGDLILTFNSMVNFIDSFSTVGFGIMYVIISLNACSDYFNLYERKPEMDLKESIEKPPLQNIKGNIEFKNVEFYYPNDKNKKLIFKGINLNFESGKKIALIGESGCGKTTLVSLIERLYDVTKGQILLDGIDIRKYDIQFLRNLIGYVEQEPILFNKSIRENLLFGREKYLEEKGENIEDLMKNTCEEAYISEFINKLPKGLDYKVGIKGSKLSGGQKQRIAIGRAILIKPKILILDEATSALDNKSEEIIQKSLDNITKKNITTIIIAHRLSTIKNADLIYVLKDGNVHEQGTHEELLKKNGFYANWIRPQLIKNEIEIKEEILKKNSSLKNQSINTDIHFDIKENEISKSPDDVEANIFNVLKDLWKYKLDFIIAFLSAIGLGVLSPFKGFIIGSCINAVNSELETIRFDDGLKFSLIFLGLGILETIVDFICFLKFHTLGINLAKDYKNKMMEKYLSFHLSFFDFDRNSPGSLLTQMTLNTTQLKEFIVNIIGTTILGSSLTISTLIIGCCYEYRLTLIVFAFVPFMIFLNIFRRYIIQSDNKKSIQCSIEAGGIISECIINSRIIFAYRFKPEAIRIYLEAIDYITQKQVKDNFINGFIIGITFFCRFACNAAIFAVTKKYIFDNVMDSDDMAEIQFLLSNVIFSISAELRDYGFIKKFINSIKNIYSIIETDSLIPHYKKDNINKLSAENIKGKIELKNVYFAYPTNPDHIVLNNVSFIIKPGEKVALVGYSGSGKSSIIQLLNRFYDIENGKGEILIDDINIKEYNLYELRKKIGFVPQEPSIFKISSIENIRYGNLKATDEECIQAAKEADALKILKKENHKGDSFLENKKEEKIFLSGGEKQKIAVARTFLKNPSILLLDEPTSALDKESEENLQRSLDKLSINKTTVAIAHRLNTIENYDKIIVLNNGVISEQGTHEELMKLQKRYYTLHKYSK